MSVVFMKEDLIQGIYHDAIMIQKNFENNDFENMEKGCEELCKKYDDLNAEDYFIKLPKNKNLPFFAYGIFKPGQLSYSKIEKYVSNSPKEYDIPHEMRYRDGIPFIIKNENDEGYKTKGFLIKFKNENDSINAYREICKSEPDKLYYWREKPICVNGELANVLVGKKPSHGSYIDRSDGPIGNYDGKKDPFFEDAIEIIEEDLYKDWNPNNLKDFFILQMKYALLWASIERYCNFRYDYKSINQMLIDFATKEKVFAESLQGNISPNEEILRKQINRKLTNDEEKLKFIPIPKNRKVYSSKNLDNAKLNPKNPKKSINYYYTIRCNVVHRGKSRDDEKEMLFPSLVELLNIFKAVLKESFKN